MGTITKLHFNSNDEWRDNRNKYIGGSDAAPVLGLSPYKSPFALWAEKTGVESGFAGNIATEVGNELEDFVARKFCEATGKSVRRLNYTLVNSDYPWACANVDRLVVGEKSILECKTTSSMPILRKTKNGEIPEMWYCQVMHYMAVLGPEYKKAYIAVLVSNREFHWFEVQRDDAEIAALMAAEKDFWQLVQTNTPPVSDGLESTTAAIKMIWGEDDGTDAGELDSDISRAIEMMNTAKAAKAEAEKIIAEAENKIKVAMQEHSYGRAGRYQITYKAQRRDTFDRKLFSADHPEINLAGYSKVSTYRVLRLKEDKD